MSLKQAWEFLAAFWPDGDDAEKSATGLGEGYVPTLQADDTVVWRPGSDGNGVRAAISAIFGLLASKASLLSPNFIGTPRINGTPIPTTSAADLTEAQAGISALSGQLASKAPLLSPNFIGTPKANGIALATTADIASSATDLTEVRSGISALFGLLGSKAPTMSPRLLGTPTKNGVALATTADIPAAASADSDQIILASQVFGA